MPLSELDVEPGAEKATSSRERILSAAKQLFARDGYENTSTVAIAREAGTSESQLMKHFGSKQGLLAAILDRGWAGILRRVEAQHSDAAPAEQLISMLEAIVIELENDPCLKELMTLEARRVRKDSREVLLSKGHQQFVDLLDSHLSAMRAREQVRPELNLHAVRAALIGMVESLLRDQVVARRSELPSSYSFDDIRNLTHTLVFALGS